MSARSKLLGRRALSIWPRLEVDAALVQAAELEDIKRRAERRDVGKVPMTAAARALFDRLRARVLDIDSDIVELAGPRSVSYHGPEFFLEVLPRKNRISLLLAGSKFFVYAQYEGGVNISIRSADDMALALPMIRQAHALISA